jgi:uncharacterized protein (DUF1697 family)
MSEKKKELEEMSSETEKYKFLSGDLFSLIDKKTDQKVFFSNNFVEKISGTPGTTRNRNSLVKILQLAEEINPLH